MAIVVRILLSLALLAVWMDPTAADGSQVDSVSEPFHGEISRGVERRDEAAALEVTKPPRTRRLTKKKALKTAEEPQFIHSPICPNCRLKGRPSGHPMVHSPGDPKLAYWGLEFLAAAKAAVMTD
ncbi:hypothetical protein H310_09562 [Aphanomyces invadans]|uniref:RxLR effector protein n=1 Tax=Aphanomyces invadans TaxID=157072 RepID=A0A024TU26_9STRA|nr:hypothetical protein H310_09562 [Aphanomyces invadans]ETV97675.1 hypothetical protein H310_09562 [Aphanomyces invadans]|eukprot:XP_008873884.1 hypothetical protein H310_09562 [Aphanomyces invadans]